MDRDPDKYEAKANFQLVYTGQYRQHACPFTGKEVTSESPQVEVDGGSLGVVEVKVCSDEMVKQLEAMEFGLTRSKRSLAQRGLKQDPVFSQNDLKQKSKMY